MLQTDQRTYNIEMFLSTIELMQMLGIIRSSIYRLMAKGLPTLKVGAINRFPHDQVLEWLKEG